MNTPATFIFKLSVFVYMDGIDCTVVPIPGMKMYYYLFEISRFVFETVLHFPPINYCKKCRTEFARYNESEMCG